MTRASSAPEGDHSARTGGRSDGLCPRVSDKHSCSPRDAIGWVRSSRCPSVMWFLGLHALTHRRTRVGHQCDGRLLAQAANHRAIYRLCWDLPKLFWQRQRSTGAVTAATFIVHRSPPSRRARRKCFGRGAAINVAVPAGSTVIPVYTGSTIITVHAGSPPTTTSYTVSPPAAAICYLLHHRRRLKS